MHKWMNDAICAASEAKGCLRHRKVTAPRQYRFRHPRQERAKMRTQLATTAAKHLNENEKVLHVCWMNINITIPITSTEEYKWVFVVVALFQFARARVVFVLFLLSMSVAEYICTISMAFAFVLYVFVWGRSIINTRRRRRRWPNSSFYRQTRIADTLSLLLPFHFLPLAVSSSPATVVIVVVVVVSVLFTSHISL